MARGAQPEQERIVLHVDMDAFYASVHARQDPTMADVPLVVGADPRGGRGRGVVSTANYPAREFGIRSAMPINEAYRRCPHARFIRPEFALYKPASQDVMAIIARYADPAPHGDDGGQGSHGTAHAGATGGDRERGSWGAARAGAPGRDDHGPGRGVQRLDAHRPLAHQQSDRAPLALFEAAGLDEAYLDITRRSGGDRDAAHNLARSLQAAIRRETGLSCSIGVAPSKSVAKIASDHRKPHGITLVTAADVADFLDPLPVGLVNGCGPKTADRLREWDIRTVGELAGTDRGLLEGRFGSHGGWLHDVANGIDPRPVRPDRGASKSRGNERTYLRDESDPHRVLAHARRLVDGLLQSHDRRAFTTITVKLRYSDFTTLTRSHTLSVSLDPGGAETATLAAATVDALLEPLLGRRAIRLVGVRLSGFRAATGQRALTEFGARALSVKRCAGAGAGRA